MAAASQSGLQPHLYTAFSDPGEPLLHGLRTPREDIAFTVWPKIQSQSQIFRYDRSIFRLPHRPNFSDIFDLRLHWVSVVRVMYVSLLSFEVRNLFSYSSFNRFLPHYFKIYYSIAYPFQS